MTVSFPISPEENPRERLRRLLKSEEEKQGKGEPGPESPEDETAETGEVEEKDELKEKKRKFGTSSTDRNTPQPGSTELVTGYPGPAGC